MSTCHIAMSLMAAVSFLIVNPASMSLAETPTPQDDLILPMPGGGQMAFRAVCIGEGDGQYAWKRFRLGDPAGGYKEFPTGVALGGAFPVKGGDSGDWCYYLGKNEVTEAQWYAFNSDVAEFKDSSYPVRNISWFAATDFVRDYNEWLFSNAADALPKYGGVPGYLRLPTEAEWEFAARGGSVVDSAQFDRKLPYSKKKIAQYEWFSGPKSSHNKVKKVGVLLPNKLGIHDMLGNVAEMTRSLYQIEYYQGRSGGYVSRGGHYLTDAKQLRSSLRTEQEFYSLNSRTKKVEPARKNTLGFRLAITSLVFPNRQVSNSLKTEWEDYRKGKAQSLPAAVSTGSASTKTNVSGGEVVSHLKRLRSELKAGGVMTESIQQELDLLASSLEDIQFVITQAEKDSAYAWIKIGSEQAFFLVRESRKLPILEGLLESAKKNGRTAIIKKLKQRELEIDKNIERAISSYTESIRQLGNAGSTALDDGFGRYREFLQKTQADDQLALIKLVRNHADFYLKNKRTDDTRWQQDLMEWSVGNTQ